MKNTQEKILLFGVGIASLGLDIWSKAYFAGSMRLGQSTEVIKNFFHITLARNTGAAFSMGNTMPRPWFIGLSVLALVALLYMFYQAKPKHLYARLGMALIISGALGNLIDRIRLGYVVDFLDVFIGKHHWPTFNVADTAISIGAVLFCFEMFFGGKAENNKAEA